jgi:hypothetical protein
VTDRVTKAVRHLTELGVGRLEDLEVLLFMSRQPEREWDAERIGTSSSMTPAVVAEALARLGKRGVVELARADPPGYRLAARVDVAQLVQLRMDHERDRTLVVNTFFTCNLDSLRSFASAFRIRKS